MTRREGEKIAVNRGEIIIEIVSIKGKYVRMVFQASKDIHIIRAEALDAKD